MWEDIYKTPESWHLVRADEAACFGALSCQNVRPLGCDCELEVSIKSCARESKINRKSPIVIGACQIMSSFMIVILARHTQVSRFLLFHCFHVVYLFVALRKASLQKNHQWPCRAPLNVIHSSTFVLFDPATFSLFEWNGGSCFLRKCDWSIAYT